MSTAVATKTAKSFMPTGKEAMDAGKDLGAILGGMIGAHAVVALTKKDTPLVNGGLLVVGSLAAMKVKNPLLRMLSLGAAAYGGIRLINNGVKVVAAPETTEGLNGILPESAKALIRKFIPTLSGLEELAGEEDFSGGDDDINGLSLDDFENRSEPKGIEGFGNTEELVSGLGDTVELVA